MEFNGRSDVCDFGGGYERCYKMVDLRDVIPVVDLEDGI